MSFVANIVNPQLIDFADSRSDSIDLRVVYDCNENKMSLATNEDLLNIVPKINEEGVFSGEVYIDGVLYDLAECIDSIEDGKDDCFFFLGMFVSWKVVVGCVALLVGVGVLTYALTEINFNGVKYDVRELSRSVVDTINKYSYFLAKTGDDGKLYISKISVSQNTAVAYLRAATRKSQNSVYHFNSSYAREVAYLALNCVPDYHNAHKIGYYNHYHVAGHKLYGHAFYGWPRVY